MGVLPGFTKIIVEVVTDEGLVGLGEAGSLECETFIREAFAPKLLGRNPFDLEGCERLCVPETRVMTNLESNTVLKAFGAVEIALWDLRGKAWQQPLYQLLGGACRKEVAFSEYFAPREQKGRAGGESTPAEIADYCARMRAQHGSTCFEGKCMNGAPNLTVELVRELRSALGTDSVIRLDANMAYSLPAARSLLAQLEPYEISNFEDPVGNFFEMEKLRWHSRIPFSSHTPDLQLAVRLGVPDTLVLNLTAVGGISRTLKFIAACEAMGVDFSFYSGDSGVMTAAYLHVAAATRHIRQPSQTLLRWQTDDVIAEGPFKVKNNMLPVPDGPGLGVTLDPSALKRCHSRFRDEGPYDYFRRPENPEEYARLP